MTKQEFNRRQFLVASAGFTTAAILAACAPATAPPAAESEGEAAPDAAPVTIAWLGPFVPPYRFEWLQGPLMDMWQETNSNITVEMEQASSWGDTEEKALVRWAAGGGPDLIQMGETGAVTEFASRGMFAPLDAFMDADPEIKPDLFYEAPFAAGQFDGQTFAIPQDSITEIFFYNKNHFEEAGIEGAPQTLEDISEYTQALSALDATDFGLEIALDGWNTYTCYLYANGGSFLDAECSVPQFNDEVGVETLTYLIDMVNAGVASPHGTEANLSNGRASMTESVPWIVGWTQNYAPEIYEALGATIMPAGKAGNDVWGWAHYESLMETSENQDAAWEFLAWMLSEEIDPVYHENLNFLPAQPRTFEKPPFNEHFAWSVFGDQLELTRTMPLCTKWREISTDVLVPELEAAWIGEKSPEEALNTAAEKALEKLEEA